MKTPKITYNINSESGLVNEVYEPEPESPVLLTFQTNGIQPTNPIHQDNCLTQCEISKQNRSNDQFLLDVCSDKGDSDEEFCSPDMKEADQTNDSGLAANAIMSKQVMGIPGENKTNHKAHPPARIAKRQQCTEELPHSQGLTSLWPGHRPLNTSVNDYLQQQPHLQPTSQPCAFRDFRAPDINSELTLGVSKSGQSLPPSSQMTSSSSTPELCSQVSLCSLQIDSGLGSEATSVRGSTDRLVNNDALNLYRDQGHLIHQLGRVSTEAIADFNMGAKDTIIGRSGHINSSFTPSIDDPGSTHCNNRQVHEAVCLHRDAPLDGEALPHSKNIKTRSSVVDLITCFSSSCSSSPPPHDGFQVPQAIAEKARSNSTLSKLPKEELCAKYTSCRWVLAYLCFLARFMQTALRQSLGIAIIGMTMKMTERVVSPDAGWEAWEADMARNETALSNSTGSSTEPVFNNVVQTESGLKWTDEYGHNWTMLVTTDAEFRWSSAFEGIVLASFSAGSLITPIIVGYLTCRYGGRKLMTVCLLAGGIFTVLLPVAATSHPALIIVFRVITGVSLSGTDSMVQAMWARWAPKFEKASLSSVAYTGTSAAGSVTYLICGYLASIGGEGRGWPYIFYILGSLGVLLAPLWWYCVHNSPEAHPRMTANELIIITSNRKGQEVQLNKSPLNPPWRKIFSSPAVWVILVGHISNKWITSFMMSYMPRFVADLFHYDLQTVQNGTAQAMQPGPPSVGTMEGLFASLPFMGRIFSGLVAAMISDWMLRVGVPTATTRKTFQALGNWSCGACTLLLAFIPMNPAMSMGFLVLALTMQNLTSVAYKINLLDIAPRYAGLLNGVMSTVSTVASLPAPVITSLLIADGSQEGWQAVFCMVAGLTTFGGLIFILFAKGEIQDWAVPPVNATTPTDPEANPTGPGRKRRNSGDGTEDNNEEYVGPPGLFEAQIGGPVREVQSLPVSRSETGGGKPKQKLRRSATVEVGAFVRRVRMTAFSNLPFADFP